MRIQLHLNRNKKYWSTCLNQAQNKIGIWRTATRTTSHLARIINHIPKQVKKKKAKCHPRQGERSTCILNKRVKSITTQRRTLEPVHCTKGIQVKRPDGSCLIKERYPSPGQDLRRVLGRGRRKEKWAAKDRDMTQKIQWCQLESLQVLFYEAKVPTLDGYITL